MRIVITDPDGACVEIVTGPDGQVELKDPPVAFEDLLDVDEDGFLPQIPTQSTQQ